MKLTNPGVRTAILALGAAGRRDQRQAQCRSGDGSGANRWM